jgi:HTH-type transcriptional regulator/antitoxin HigA
MINALLTDEDHTAALREIERLWLCDEATPESDELERLVALVEAYAIRRWPIGTSEDPK